MRSVMMKYFDTARSALVMCGPRMIPTPALPVRPMGTGLVQTGLLSGQPGILKAAGLNHWLMSDPSLGYKLMPGTTSGRPPKVLVFDGSKPENDGVKN